MYGGDMASRKEIDLFILRKLKRMCLVMQEMGYLYTTALSQSPHDHAKIARALKGMIQEIDNMRV